MEVREVVGFSWILYKRRFGTFLAVSLPLVGIPTLLQWLPGIGGLMSMVLFLTQLLATGAFIRIAAAHCVDLRTSAGESVRTAWSRYGKMLGMWVIFGLGVAAVATVMIIIGSVILAVVAFGMVEQLNSFAEDPFAMPLGTLLPFLVWTFVMLLPAIALAMMWSVAPMAIMIEGVGATASLRRSWRLVLSDAWRVTRVVLLAVVVVGVPCVVLFWALPYYLAVLILNLLTLPFTSVVGTVLYLDLRARSEELSSATLTDELTSGT